ncbi:hypothetical protein GCM10010517_64730 [Streptosporangium fragile]|uniref:DUF4386 family protein n=1 Tax=Streptosporangium fragile TaxID=46186 RepID=A0ABP6IQ18_9ACTN
MKESHEFRWGGLAGVGALVFAIVGRLVMGGTPRIADPATTISGYLLEYRTQILAGALLYAVSTVLLLWFGVALATAFRRADEAGDAPAMVLAGYVLIAGIGFVAISVLAGMATAFTANPALLAIAAGPYTVLAVMGTIAGIAVAVPFGASAVAIMRTRVFPRWMAWFALLVAVLNVLAAFTVGIREGVLAPDGLLVGYLPGVLTALWVLAASGLLIREHLPVRAAGARPVMGH